MFRILYTSSRIDDTDGQGLSRDFEAIGVRASQKNAGLGLTGFLICTPNWYAQILEGEKSAVLNLFDVIAEDTRHSNVVVLDRHPMTDRMFGRWTMAWRHQNINNRIQFLERDLAHAHQPKAPRAAALYDLARALAAA